MMVSMNLKVLLLAAIYIDCTVNGATEKPLPSSNQEKFSTGKYIHTNRGRYMPQDDTKYVHIHDMRELGRYIHIPFPYDGGYGPYTGKNIPYEYDPTGEYSIAKYQTVSTPFEFDPFRTSEYTIPIPEICLQYGFPKFPYYHANGDAPEINNDNVPITRKSLQKNNNADDLNHPSTSNSENSIFNVYEDNGNSYIIKKRQSDEVGINDTPNKNDAPLSKNENTDAEKLDNPASIPHSQNIDIENLQNDTPIFSKAITDADSSNTEKPIELIVENENVEDKNSPQNNNNKSSDDTSTEETLSNSDSHNTDIKNSELINTKLDEQNTENTANLENENLIKKNLDIPTNSDIEQLDNQNSDHADNIERQIISDDEQTNHVRVRKSIFNYSQTKLPQPKTTARPRTRYDDEGKWRIIKQSEKKQKMNYEYLYETENGIVAQERAVINKQSNNKDGTNGYGFYQYPGDDGKIYRVEYTVGEQGFIPKGDHLPKALQQSLELHRRKNKNNL